MEGYAEGWGLSHSLSTTLNYLKKQPSFFQKKASKNLQKPLRHALKKN